jgi:hypothetical protein
VPDWIRAPAECGRVNARTHAVHNAKRAKDAESATAGLGQSNIYYTRERNGQSRDFPWIAAAVEYVRVYQDQVLGSDGVDSEMAAEIDAERKAGFESNPRIRKAIEKRAMQVVPDDEAYQASELKDFSNTKPYDYAYPDGQTERYIEVKGTRSHASEIILTANAVAFARGHAEEILSRSKTATSPGQAVGY